MNGQNTPTDAGSKVAAFRAEYYDDATGIGAARPRLSWRMVPGGADWIQGAYEIRARRALAGSVAKGAGEEAVAGKNLAAGGDGWAETSGRVEGDSSVLVPWPFAELASRERVELQVRVWRKGSGISGPWSDTLAIEAGLLSPSDWTARFVGPEAAGAPSGSVPGAGDGKPAGPTAGNPAGGGAPAAAAPCPYLRKGFRLGEGLAGARLYASALGLYQCYLNGHAVGDRLFAPGWTAYDARIDYQTYDVTGLLRAGDNAFGAILAEGWYKGRLGFEGGRKNVWGDRLGFIGQLELTYRDGRRETIVTDESWRASTGSILSSGIYDGERVDLTLEPEGWKEPGFDDSGWRAVSAVDRPTDLLVAGTVPPAREIETLPVREVIASPSGKTLLDFGQNIAGSLRLRVKGKAGDKITVRHAEVLENGELGTRPLRLAEATDCWILRGEGEEILEPLFTYHGFRYAEIDGWPGELDPTRIEARVIHADMGRTGWLETSDALVNRLHENVRWGLKGNFLSVPTDCPQRDERLGWTGDIQVFAPTATFLYDSAPFLESWLRDLAAEQKKLGGAVPPVIPNAMGESFGAAAWGDAATVIPRVLHERLGDAGVLETQFESMASWVDYIAENAGERRIWDSGFQFGDWLDPTAPPNEPWAARTAKEIVATAYYARSARIVAESARILGKKEAEAKYAEIAGKAAAAFVSEYVTPSGRMMSDAETAYSLAIAFDLMPTEAQKARAGERLAQLAMEGGYRIRTGFVGTPIVCDALCRTGHYREAYRLLTQTEKPSWLYPVTMGATTMWERWDSMLPDGSVNPGEMTSFNHYALGAVADWMHRTVGGIEAVEPGFRRIRVAPRPGGGMTKSEARHLSPYGEIAVRWEIDGGEFRLEATVPPNCRAELRLPGTDRGEEVGSGTHTRRVPYVDPDVRGAYTADDKTGEILADPPAFGALMGVLERFKAPGYVKAIIFGEKGVKLGTALKMLPDPDPAIKAINEAFAEAHAAASSARAAAAPANNERRAP